MNNMNCYQCDAEGQERAAVGVCQECGRAVCRQHLVVQRLPIYRRVAAGMGFRVDVLPEKRSRILCKECAEVADRVDT